MRSTHSEKPHLHAKNNVVIPELLMVFTSAPAWMSFLMLSHCGTTVAIINGLQLTPAFTSAPACMRISMHWWWPFSAAYINAVTLSASFPDSAFTSAAQVWTSRCTHCMYPRTVAYISGVWPWESRVFTLAPWCIHISMRRTSPSRAAASSSLSSRRCPSPPRVADLRFLSPRGCRLSAAPIVPNHQHSGRNKKTEGFWHRCCVPETRKTQAVTWHISRDYAIWSDPQQLFTWSGKHEPIQSGAVCLNS